MTAVRPRTLLVTPAFHDYGRSIGEALGRQGHDVVTVRYDAYDTLAQKLRLKATVELPERLPVVLRRGAAPRRAERARLTDRVLAALGREQPDRVLVVKGDALDERFWDAVSGRPVALWLYDDLHRHEHTPEILRGIDLVATYSRSEAALLSSEHGVRAMHLPLAFDPHRTPVDLRRSGLVAFVGAGYPHRVQVLTELAARGLPVHAWGRDFSPHPIDRLRTWSWRRPPVAGSRDVSLAESYRIAGQAAAAVNIHGTQTDASMRTFEIPGMAGVQLVDRDDVAEFYDLGTEVAVWHDVDELTALCRRALTDTAWADGLRTAGRARTLAEHTFDHRMRTLEASWD